ncbi:MAG: sugar-binding domain-containing protein [Pseudomonadota bacterium]
MAQSEDTHKPEQTDAWPEQLAVRVAWCYYTLGLTQQEVAARLGITRVRVNRLLAEARRRGVVQISITSDLAENVELEERLKAQFALTDARVVLTVGDDVKIADTLGGVGAEILAPQFADGSTIGVGWGMTLRALALAMPERRLPDASVVAMLGSLTRRSSIDAFEAATALAHRLHAECFYMPGPLICDSAAGRDAIESQPLVEEIKERARRADIAVVSVGGLDSGTIRLAGLITAISARRARSLISSTSG